MSRFIDARVIQKTDTEDKWLQNELILYKGELALVQSDNQIVNIKVGTGRHKFRDLPYLINYTSGLYTKAITLNSQPSGDAYQSYIVTEAGTYINFGGMVLPKDYMGVIYKNLDQYTISLLPIVSEETLKEYINEKLVDANLGFGGQLTDLSQSPTVQGMYIPRVEGVYPNFGGLKYDSSEGLVIFLYKDNEYTKISIPLDAVDEDVRFSNEALGVSGKAVEKFAIKKINNIAELRNTQGEYEGQIIELLGYYNAGEYSLKYKWTNTQIDDNEGSVINSNNGSWIAQLSSTINARYFGIKYDDLIIDNSKLINKCINYASVNNIREVLLPEGNLYLDLYINKDSEPAWARLNNYAVELKSNIDLNIKANLKLKTKNIAEYNILRLKNTSNINIYGGGIVEGDVIDNADSSLEFGFGIQIFNSQDVTISDLEIKNCLGDGIILNSYSSSNPVNTNIKVLNNKIHTNSRQGISILDGDRLDIYNNYIYNTGLIKGKLPMAGIDIEPEASNSVRNVNIINNSIYDNFGQQISLIALKENSEIQNIVISNNNINNSNRRNQQKSITSIQLTTSASNSKYIQNVSITDNDISMVSAMSDSESQVIYLSKSNNVKIRNNNIIIKDDSVKGIMGANNNNIDISDNSIKNSLRVISMTSTNNLLIKGNYFDNFKYGVTCVLSNDIKILNNTILGDINSTILAIQILYGKYSIVNNNNINNIYGNTINIGDSHKHSIISNNIITNCGISTSDTNCISIYSTITETTQFVVIKDNMFNYLDDIIYNNSLLINSTARTNNINVIGNIINKKDTHSLREYSFNSPTTSRYLPIIKQSLNVVDTTAADATDLATALVLINELKVKLNAKLTADRNSGQQAT